MYSIDELYDLYPCIADLVEDAKDNGVDPYSRIYREGSPTGECIFDYLPA